MPTNTVRRAAGAPVLAATKNTRRDPPAPPCGIHHRALGGVAANTLRFSELYRVIQDPKLAERLRLLLLEAKVDELPVFTPRQEEEYFAAFRQQPETLARALDRYTVLICGTRDQPIVHSRSLDVELLAACDYVHERATPAELEAVWRHARGSADRGLLGFLANSLWLRLEKAAGEPAFVREVARLLERGRVAVSPPGPSAGRPERMEHLEPVIAPLTRALETGWRAGVRSGASMLLAAIGTPASNEALLALYGPRLLRDDVTSGDVSNCVAVIGGAAKSAPGPALAAFERFLALEHQRVARGETDRPSMRSDPTSAYGGTLSQHLEQIVASTVPLAQREPPGSAVREQALRVLRQVDALWSVDRRHGHPSVFSLVRAYADAGALADAVKRLEEELPRGIAQDLELTHALRAVREAAGDVATLPERLRAQVVEKGAWWTRRLEEEVGHRNASTPEGAMSRALHARRSPREVREDDVLAAFAREASAWS